MTRFILQKQKSNDNVISPITRLQEMVYLREGCVALNIIFFIITTLINKGKKSLKKNAAILALSLLPIVGYIPLIMAVLAPRQMLSSYFWQEIG